MFKYFWRNLPWSHEGEIFAIEANALACTINCTQKAFGWILDSETGSTDSLFVISVTLQTFLKDMTNSLSYYCRYLAIYVRADSEQKRMYVEVHGKL